MPAAGLGVPARGTPHGFSYMQHTTVVDGFCFHAQRTCLKNQQHVGVACMRCEIYDVVQKVHMDFPRRLVGWDHRSFRSPPSIHNL